MKGREWKREKQYADTIWKEDARREAGACIDIQDNKAEAIAGTEGKTMENKNRKKPPAAQIGKKNMYASTIMYNTT